MADEMDGVDYAARYRAVNRAIGFAQQLNYEVGFSLDPLREPYGVVVYIELPTRQVSWHMPSQHVWDGHTTEEKYARIRAYLEAYPRC